jgi:HSP20 family protein
MQSNTLNKMETPTPNGMSTGQAQRQTFVTPLASIQELPEGYLLEVEMPGVNKDGLEITIENGELTLVGHYVMPEVKGREIFRETRRVDYRRVFELDPSIDVEHVEAKIDQGLLKVRLSKAESVKPRRIEVG